MISKSTVGEIQKRFDGSVERYSNLETGQETVMDAPLILELIALSASVCNPEAKRVLDIGCSAGNNTMRLLQFIYPLDCDLIDLSKPMKERAKQRIRAVNSGRIREFQKDIREVELEKERYDIIIAASVLHHLREKEEWEATFMNIHRSLTSGGSFWISDFICHESPKIQKIMKQHYGMYLDRLHGADYRRKKFELLEREDSPRSLMYQTALLEKVGFNKIEILHKNICFAAFGAIKF